MLIHLVEMLKWNKEESLHYTVGAYTSLEKAKLVGDAEKVWRNGKYEPHVITLVVDEDPKAELYGYHKECMKNETAKQTGCGKDC